MKKNKIINVVIFGFSLLLPLGSAQSQMVTSDPIQQGISITGFAKSLAEAIKTTAEVTKGLEQAKATAELLAKAEKRIKQVDSYINQLQELKESAEAIASIVNAGKRLYENIKKFDFTLSEARYLTDEYTHLLNRANLQMKELMTIIKTKGDNGEGFEGSAYERKKLIDESSRKIQDLTSSSSKLESLVDKSMETQRRYDLAVKNNLVSPMEMLYMELTFLPGSLPLGTEMQLALMMGAQNSSSAEKGHSIQSATAEYGRNLSAFGKLFLMISGIVFLIGLFRVVQKLFNGDTEGAKSIGIWLGGLVLVLVIVNIINVFIK